MAKFRYTAKTADARTVKEVESASNKEELISRLRSRGLFIVSLKLIKEGKSTSKSGSPSSGRSRGKRMSLRLNDLVFLARNLSTTLYGGVTLLRSLEILSAQTESGKLDKVLNECGQHVKAGLSLAEALRKYPAVFTALWVGIVEVGEASGNLPFVLGRLADYLELRLEFERKIKTALVYPFVVMLAAVVVVTFFFKVILPRFSEIFSQMDVELPLATRIIFRLTDSFNRNFIFLVIGLGVFIVFFDFMRKHPKVIKFWDEISLKLPLVGKSFIIFNLERFTSTMAILLDSGLPLVYTLDVTANVVGNYVFSRDILRIKEKVKDGCFLSDELARLDNFPLLVSEMAKVGEETGSMAEVFKKIAEYYERELVTGGERLMAVFEPAMIIMLGIIIGGIAVSLFLPLFQISTMGT
ncbi:MAG: type II secretion system F family protein [Candidatus Omnitrophota bacterium]